MLNRELRNGGTECENETKKRKKKPVFIRLKWHLQNRHNSEENKLFKWHVTLSKIKVFRLGRDDERKQQVIEITKKKKVLKSIQTTIEFGWIVIALGGQIKLFYIEPSTDRVKGCHISLILKA